MAWVATVAPGAAREEAAPQLDPSEELKALAVAAVPHSG